MMVICHRPGTPTSSRVRSTAVGLLLLVAMSSFLVGGTAEFASSSSAEGTAPAASGRGGDTASFDKDVVVSPVAKAKAAAMARDHDLRRAEEAADSSLWKGRRSLQSDFDFANDTTSAPLSAGNNNTACGGLSDCINGCHSHFYKVTGATRGVINANTCGSVDFVPQLYVWKGSGSDCSTFTCTGTRAAWFVLVLVGSG
jgi:hypothetical protein